MDKKDQNPSQTCLVTGGSGFFGAYLVEALIKSDWRVRVFDIFDSHDRPAGAEFIKGDIRDYDAVQDACKDVDMAFHCVAMVPLAKDAQAFWSVNRDGTENLLRACHESGASKVVHISSSAVFGIPGRNPVDDTVAPAPLEDYGRAKLAAEGLCQEYSDKGLDVTIVRPRTTMGKGRLGIMQIIFEWVRQGHNLPVLGKGDNLYQFVHAQDLAEACIKAAMRPGPAVYNIGAEKFCSMRETLEGLIAHAGTKSRVVSLPMGLAIAGMRVSSRLGISPLGPYHHIMYGRSMYFDIARAKAELSWTPCFGNVEMFCESYDDYIEHRGKILVQEGGSHHRSAVRQGILNAGVRFLDFF